MGWEKKTASGTTGEEKPKKNHPTGTKKNTFDLTLEPLIYRK